MTDSRRTEDATHATHVRAADLLAAGAWQQAHALVDDDPTTMGAWLHGIVHTLEGDLGNARYWYGVAKREFPGAEHVAREIAEVRAALSRDPRG